MPTPVYDALYTFLETKPHNFFMPGHKGKPFAAYADLSAFFSFDLTELAQTDNLYAPEHFLREAQLLMSRAFHTQETCFLVNGATAGILAMFLGSFQEGDTVLIDRSCHQSVISAIILAGLSPVYVYPDFDPFLGLPLAISPQEIRQKLQAYPQVKGIFITSPNYFGITQNIAEIAQIAQQYQIPVLVDEAHGAHFSFCDRFPKPAIAQGADVCVQSMHKTLPAPNQTALLHFAKQSGQNERIKKALAMVQTSSPSFPFLALMDIARDALEQRGQAWYTDYFEKLDIFYDTCAALRRITLFHGAQKDPGRIVAGLMHTAVTGQEASKTLSEKFNLIPELAADRFLLFLTTPNNTQEDFDALARALFFLDTNFPGGLNSPVATSFALQSELIMRPRDAYFAAHQTIPIQDAAGKICAQHVLSYPPGIPMITYGERISREAVDFLTKNHIQKSICVVY